MIKVGDIIMFNDEIRNEDFTGADIGIMARVVGFHNKDSIQNGCTEIKFDISEFEKQNEHKWGADFWDDERHPTLTYPETKFYKTIISYYFMDDDIASDKYWDVTSDVVMHDDTASMFWAMLMEIESNCTDKDILNKNLVEQGYDHWNRAHPLEPPKKPRWK